MPTNFPGSVDTFSVKTDNVSDVMAADVNNLQDAMVAVQNRIGTTAAPNFVTMTGNQTIAGNKTFSGDVTVASRVLMGNATSPNTATLQWGDNSGWTFRMMTNVSGTPTLRYSFTDTGNFTATGNVTANGQFSGNGAALTNLNASNLASGTVPIARLGTGTANSTTFLRGDNTWQPISTEQVLNATAGAAVGAVGTYAFARRSTTGDIAFGSTVAGSTLTPISAVTSIAGGGASASTVLPPGAALAGTWRAMGTYTHTATSGGEFPTTITGATLWLRIS